MFLRTDRGYEQGIDVKELVVKLVIGVYEVQDEFPLSGCMGAFFAASRPEASAAMSRPRQYGKSHGSLTLKGGLP